MPELLNGFLSGILIYTKMPIFYVLVGLVVLRMIYRLKRPAIRGVIGEWKVNRRLAKLGGDYRVFADLYVPNGEGGTTQVDHIVTSTKGIFVIETKHYSGWIFGSDRQKNWTQVIYKRKEKLYNPIWQNFGHIQSLKGYLNNENLDIHSIIAFSSDAKLKFKEPFETAHVIHANELNKVIIKFGDNVLSEAELKRINDLLEQLVFTDRLEKRQVKKAHLEFVKRKQFSQKPSKLNQPKVNASAMKSESNKPIPLAKLETAVTVEESANSLGDCPRCASELVQRRGKYGEFVGCSAYPKCRFTLKKEA
ncbi:NERD domain-containing protein [Sporosarcina aquimarina]|uniref:NERD domain-containing protein n=1 Tax=Sporosarcina aquimarina TaxID=114975 RepID=A0ABU4G199_9BACL|nr:NERD domain-containing protein [Sporosarcina aquimarina]MDW0110744.1 NERD domain-containing protein [Sporosarcina aquimarina]